MLSCSGHWQLFSSTTHPARQGDPFLLPYRKSRESVFLAEFAIMISTKLFVCFTTVHPAFCLSLYPFFHYTPRSDNFTLKIFIATKIERDFFRFASLATSWPLWLYTKGGSYFNLIFFSIKCTCFPQASKNADCVQLRVILKL